jgi:thymidylate synthase ThyX
MYEAKILADSHYWISSPKRRARLTTFEITAPRFILAEINTHRMLSRNSASSRAIPVAKSIRAVEDDPFIPDAFPRNVSGMTGGELMEGDAANYASLTWQSAAYDAVEHATSLEKLGVHKGWANRILEPFKWQTTILSGTDWSNFFALRMDENAQPEFRKIVEMMHYCYWEHLPDEPGFSDVWCHLPLVTREERFIEPNRNWKLVSVGRCARVSYLTHDGVRDPLADITLAERLMTNGHLSPFEHVARPFNQDEWNIIHELHATLNNSLSTDPFGQYLYKQIEYQGNFHGWHQFRADIKNQHDYSLVKGAN